MNDIKYSEKKGKLCLFGAGRIAQMYATGTNTNFFRSITLHDNDPSRIGNIIGGLKVLSTEEADKEAWWCVLIQNAKARDEVRLQCLQNLGFQREKELNLPEVIQIAYDSIIFDKVVPRKNDSCAIVIGSLQGEALGGVELYTMSLCSMFLQYGYRDVTYVSDHREYPIPPILAEHMYYYDRTMQYKEETKPLGIRFELREIERLAFFLGERIPCTVVVSGPDELLLTACKLKKDQQCDIRIYAVLHNDMARTYEAFLSFERHYGNIDGYIGVSRKIQNDLCKVGIPKEKVYCMTCPVSIDAELKRNYTLNRRDSIKIAYAGRLDGFKGSQKRMDMIVATVQELRARNVNFLLTIAGDGQARMEMEQQLLSNETSDVIFSGQLRRDNMSAFWREQDAFINLSDFEGHSISQMEAMANGAVPVLTDVSGARDDVTDGENGFVVPIGDWRMAAERISYLEKNRELLPKMGAKAHSVILEKATEKKHLEFWKSLGVSIEE